ncbi:MAG: MmoB/DmpM family protein [Mycobacterium sp.]
MAARTDNGPRTVGVVLQASDETRPIVEAIEADNPEVMVSEIPGALRLQSAGELVIRRESVTARLGREWDTQEFQLAMVSYFGNIAEWDDDEIVIKWDH